MTYQTCERKIKIYKDTGNHDISTEIMLQANEKWHNHKSSNNQIIQSQKCNNLKLETKVLIKREK